MTPDGGTPMREILTPDVFFFFDGKPGALALYEALAAHILAEYPDAGIRVLRTQIDFCEGRHCCESGECHCGCHDQTQ